MHNLGLYLICTKFTVTDGDLNPVWFFTILFYYFFIIYAGAIHTTLESGSLPYSV